MSEYRMLDFKKFSGKVGQAEKTEGKYRFCYNKNAEIDDTDLDGEKYDRHDRGVLYDY